MKKRVFVKKFDTLFPLKRAVMSIEKDAIRQALEITGWNKSKAAAMLNVDYKTLLTKIKTYRISQ